MPLGGAKAAWDALLPAADKFPNNPNIPYNLACYACQMNKLKCQFAAKPARELRVENHPPLR